MVDNSIASLDEFGKQSVADIEEWLKKRLVDAHGNDRRRRLRALSFFEFGIRDVETILDGLQQLFVRLDPEAQHLFRNAVGALFTHAHAGEFPVSAMSNVITLVGTAKAYACLESFGRILGSGEWGEHAPHLFYEALAVLKTLRRGVGAYDATRDLVSRWQFPNQYVFDAYEVLLAGEPRFWDRDLEDLAPMMLEAQASAEAADQHRVLSYRYKRIGDEIVKAVSLEQLQLGVKRLTDQLRHLKANLPIGRCIISLCRYVELDPNSEEYVYAVPGNKMRKSIEPLSAAGLLFVTEHTKRPSDFRIADNFSVQDEAASDSELADLLSEADERLDLMHSPIARAA